MNVNFKKKQLIIPEDKKKYSLYSLMLEICPTLDVNIHFDTHKHASKYALEE